MIEKPPTRLFVYGTLRRDPSHEMFHLLARHANFFGEATVPGRLFDLGSYPGMVQDNARRVIGEVYDVDPTHWMSVIARLDEYEGCTTADPEPHEYRRQIVQATLDNGQRVPAWAYLLNQWPNHVREITSGDYLSWRARA